VDTLVPASCGTFVMTLWHGVLSTSSWQHFTSLAYGWALAWGRQTLTTSLWSRGAAQGRHGSRYYAFVGGALSQHRAALWTRVIHCGASLVPEHAVMAIRWDDALRQKNGRHLQGASHYRNGAGTTRQD